MLLSIIIPCFNSARFISQTLDMLISQGLDDCEVIVVNDGSTDETSRIAHYYSNKHENMKVIDKINEGVSVARNVGLANAQGRYIYFLDSDDYLEAGTLDFYRGILYRYPQNKFFATGYYTKYHEKIKKDYAVKRYDGMTLDSTLLKQSFFLKKICFHICSCIYENKFLTEHSITFTPGLRIGEDVEFLLKVLAATDSCVYHARHCFVYQIRDDSTMQGYNFYSQARFAGLPLTRNTVKRCITKETELAGNFFLANLYMLHLLYYLKSDFTDKDVSKGLIMHKDLLDARIPLNKPLRFIVIKILKVLPIGFVFRIRKKCR